jgi:hypothetical protein
MRYDGADTPENHLQNETYIESCSSTFPTCSQLYGTRLTTLDYKYIHMCIVDASAEPNVHSRLDFLNLLVLDAAQSTQECRKEAPRSGKCLMRQNNIFVHGLNCHICIYLYIYEIQTGRHCSLLLFM